MDEQARKLSDQDKKTAAELLEELAYLKKQSEQFISASDALQKSVPIFSTSDLLKTIFTVVLVIMHQRPWGTMIRSK